MARYKSNSKSNSKKKSKKKSKAKGRVEKQAARRNPEDEEDIEEENVSDEVQSFDEVDDLIQDLDKSGEEEEVDEEDSNADNFGMMGRANGDYSSDEDGQHSGDEEAQLNASAAEIMHNPVSGGCLKAYTNQNILFLLYALKLDPELLTDKATAAFQLADGLHEENDEETAQQKAQQMTNPNFAHRYTLLLGNGDGFQ